jgi:hypothetical protein
MSGAWRTLADVITTWRSSGSARCITQLGALSYCFGTYQRTEYVGRIPVEPSHHSP